MCEYILTGIPFAVNNAGHGAPGSAPVRHDSPSKDSDSALLSVDSLPPCSLSAGSTTVHKTISAIKNK